MALKIAVLTPMPSANETTATPTKPGCLARLRTLCLMSCHHESIVTPLGEPGARRLPGRYVRDRNRLTGSWSASPTGGRDVIGRRSAWFRPPSTHTRWHVRLLV